MTQADVSIIYYGKPYQTLVSLLSLLKFSAAHVRTVHITVEKKQPHDEVNGIYTVLAGLRGKVEVQTYYPKYFYNLGGIDRERVRTDADYRWMLPYQYPLERAGQPYLFILHNDMLFHRDMLGELLTRIQAESLTGIGSIGQCWSCPAGPDWGNRCNGFKFQEYVPDQVEAIALHETHATPRQQLDLAILRDGRVHPLPECRLNEYACLIDTATYRAQTLPLGEAPCFGGTWHGADLGTSWFHAMVNRGFQFRHVVLEDYARHSPFNPVGQGIQAYSKLDNYRLSEAGALAYLQTHFDYQLPDFPASQRLYMAGRRWYRQFYKQAAQGYARLHRLVRG